MPLVPPLHYQGLSFVPENRFGFVVFGEERHKEYDKDGRKNCNVRGSPVIIESLSIFAT